MAKKALPKVKLSSSKSKKTKHVSRMDVGLAGSIADLNRRPTSPPDEAFAQAVQNYEAGLKAMQSRKYERAKALLEKVSTAPYRELADRAVVHLNTCQQQLARGVSSTFKSPEEHYDYAISLMNAGEYEDARQHLQKLQKQSPKADYIWYGIALLDCLTHHYEAALKNLEEAIKLDPVNRFHARNETDLQNMADDPRFTELLYPEGASEASAAAAPPAPARNSKRR
jgi:tetratricopeptide (TPR) repeat protein